MSVEKYNPRMDYETIPYAQININVVQNITNMEAGFVWVYLQTKPKDWKIIKEHIKNHFGIGNAKIKTIFSYLAKCNLIEYVQETGEKGKFGQHDIRVLNGSRFISYPQNSTGGSIHRPSVSRSTGSGLLHIKENTKDRKAESPERKKHVPLPDNFEANSEAIESIRNKDLDQFSVVSKFIQNAKSKGLKYLDWDAALMKWILDEKKPSKTITIKSPVNEPKSTVQEWGPGHAGWESLHGIGY